MNRKQMTAERNQLLERVAFLDALMATQKPKHKAEPYGCQEYDADRLCRFDRRAISPKCAGCPRVTDQKELERVGLWVEGVSHG